MAETAAHVFEFTVTGHVIAKRQSQRVSECDGEVDKVYALG